MVVSHQTIGEKSTQPSKISRVDYIIHWTIKPSIIALKVSNTFQMTTTYSFKRYFIFIPHYIGLVTHASCWPICNWVYIHFFVSFYLASSLLILPLPSLFLVYPTSHKQSMISCLLLNLSTFVDDIELIHHICPNATPSHILALVFSSPMATSLTSLVSSWPTPTLASR